MQIILFVLGVVGVLVVWAIISVLSSRVKEPKFTVLEKKDGYTVREYAPYIEARVTVTGDYREAIGKGFRILAGYIFGGNVSKKSIAMTAPVVEQAKSESIAMTAPVIDTLTASGERVISFIMPAEYTLETLPVPNSKEIEFVEVPAHKSAVLRYSWNNTSARVEAKKAQLLALLKRDNRATSGPARSAGYNPPWTAPYMKRNEIIVDLS